MPILHRTWCYLRLQHLGGCDLCSLALGAPRQCLTLPDQSWSGEVMSWSCFQSGHCTREPDLSHLGRATQGALSGSIAIQGAQPDLSSRSNKEPTTVPTGSRASIGSLTHRGHLCRWCSSHTLPWSSQSPSWPLGGSQKQQLVSRKQAGPGEDCSVTGF